MHSVDGKIANSVALHSSKVPFPSCWPSYRKLSSTSGVPEEPSRASLSLLSSSRSSSGRVSAVSCDKESVSSSRARELKKKKTRIKESPVTKESQRDASAVSLLASVCAAASYRPHLSSIQPWRYFLMNVFDLCVLMFKKNIAQQEVEMDERNG